MPDRVPEDMPDRMLEDMPDRMPEGMPDRMPDKMSDRMPEDMPDKVPECLPDRMPEDLPEDMPDDMPDRMPDGMPEDMPEHMPEDMPGRMPEDMSDRMPEDLPVTKRINVMVGITRSKVSCIFFSNTFALFACFYLLKHILNVLQMNVAQMLVGTPRFSLSFHPTQVDGPPKYPDQIYNIMEDPVLLPQWLRKHDRDTQCTCNLQLFPTKSLAVSKARGRIPRRSSCTCNVIWIYWILPIMQPCETA